MGNIKPFCRNFLYNNSDFRKIHFCSIQIRLPILLLIIYFLIFQGCSANYALKEFESRNGFYEYVNNHIENKGLNILLDNDNIVTAAYGAQILNDSLIYDSENIDIRNEVIPLSEINSIDYKGADYKSAFLSLKNGRQLFAENMVFKPNLLQCKTTERLIIKTSIPIKEIKEINYNTHSKGIFPGALLGLSTGGLIGAFTFNIKSGGNPPLKTDHYQGLILGAFLGIIMGIYAGFIIGWNTNFHF